MVCGAKSRGFLEIVHQTNPLKFARLFLVSFLPRSPYMIHMGTPYLEQIQYETKVSKGFLKSRGRGLVCIYIYILAKGLSHISWAEVTSTPCNSELEESHINWASKYQNPNGTPAFKECCYISKNEENIAHTEVFTYV